MKTRILLAFVVAASAFAQDKPAAEKHKPVPALSMDMKEEFFKTQAEALAAQRSLDQAQQNAKTTGDAFQAALKKLQDACGDAQLTLDSKREPICVEKPKPAEK